MKKGDGIYNVIVIGAGTAGLVTAAATAGLGGRVALIERHKMGGDCLNFGCVPSKALISSARLAEQIRRADLWALRPREPEFDFAAVMKRVRERRARIAPNDSQERFESLGVEVFRGTAQFLSPDEIEVEGVKLRARHFVIATGSRATMPKIAGLDTVPFFTNETIFDQLETRPESLLVLGGGPIGCELGQAMARLGVRVTILQQGAQLLPPEDQDVATLIAQRFRDENISLHLGAEPKRACFENSRITLELADGQRVSAAALLVAAGRTPNFAQLRLEKAGVDHNEHGIVTNDYLQTSQPHIYAAGDITNRLKFTHTADFTARIVVRNMLMPVQILRQKANWSIVPWCTYTSPEVAHVGLGEKEAQRKGENYDVYRVELKEVDRAVTESEEVGLAKILTVKGSDKILGAAIVAPHAGDLIMEFVVAMHGGLGLGKIATMIHPYPTLAEIARKAGDQFNRTRLTPRAKKFFRWLYARQRG